MEYTENVVKYSQNVVKYTENVVKYSQNVVTNGGECDSNIHAAYGDYIKIINTCRKNSWLKYKI